MTPFPGSVCAVVLTYNRAELLRACLKRLLAQTHPPDQILVVDNAGADGTPEMLASAFPGVRVLTLARNVGAAGGFTAGIERAHAEGFDWLWLMDDDAYARPDALAALLAYAGLADVLVPWQVSPQGQLYGVGEWRGRAVNLDPAGVGGPRPVQLFSFIGPLLSRGALDKLGPPYAEYFIDFFDWEYSLRLDQAGLSALLVPSSVIEHEVGQQRPKRPFGLGRERLRYWQPAWKLYYDTRNYLLTIRRRRLGLRSLLNYLAIQPREMVRELVFEPDGPLRVRLRAQAMWDGARGVTGERARLFAPSTQKVPGLSAARRGQD